MAEIDILFQTEHVKMYVDPTVPCLVNEWRGFISGQDFRNNILILVDLLKEQSATYGPLNMLADTRGLEVLPLKDVEWVNEEINLRYLENGATYEAFVIPSDDYGKMSVERYVRYTTSSGVFTVKMFESIDDAKEWLRRVQESVPD